MNASPRQFPAAGRRARLLMAIIGVGLLVAAVGVWMKQSAPTYGEAEVIRTIHTVALTRSQEPGVADGGLIGPWWISAGHADPVTGELFDFSITSGSMIIAAERARVEIDPRHDTFSFEMSGVVMTSVAKSDVPGGDKHFLISREHYRLGPAPFGKDIIADGGSMPAAAHGPEPGQGSPLAGVSPP